MNAYALKSSALIPSEEAAAESQTDEGWFVKPEFYDYSGIELPENYSYDETLLNEFNELAGKYNLSPKGADEIMRLAVKLSQLKGDNYSKINAEQQRLKTEEFRNALLTDREIRGAALQKNIAAANIVCKRFTDPETQLLLQQSGLNCHPGMKP